MTVLVRGKAGGIKSALVFQVSGLDFEDIVTSKRSAGKVAFRAFAPYTGCQIKEHGVTRKTKKVGVIGLKGFKVGRRPHIPSATTHNS
jgi:hypothetical protein